MQQILRQFQGGHNLFIFSLFFKYMFTIILLTDCMQLRSWHKMNTTSILLFLFSFLLVDSNFNDLLFIKSMNSKLLNSRFFQRCLVEMMCSFFVASWTGVVKYHGPRPSIRPKQVCLMHIGSSIVFISISIII